MLALDPREGSLGDYTVGELPSRLRAGDLVVLNDAATLPASLHGITARDEPVELRLAGQEPGGAWRAVLFGEGDWRTPTEHRAPPPALSPGEAVLLGGGLTAAVTAVSALSPRLVTVRFPLAGGGLWRALYRAGRPVQYAYVSAPLPLWEVQTAFASRPWAVEMPSAGRPLTWSVLEALRARGVGLATVTHAAGLSSTGDPALDAALPLPERYEIPEASASAWARTRAEGGRVLAVGTTVVRALESAWRAHGELRAGEGVATLRLRPGDRVTAADGLLSGVHEPGSSHYDLLEAFAGTALLREATAHAEREGYLLHEFGDTMLVW
jgi:S-adenosylmethionine:tRNA ribosyltransferase-isomerase